MPRHDLGMLRHELKFSFLHCLGMLRYELGMLRHELGMLRHASLGFLIEASHAVAWQNHAAACSHDLPNLASFDSFLLLFARSLVFPLEHQLQDKNKHKNAQNR